MAYEIPGQLITVPASTDLSAKQYTFVTVNGSGQAASPAAGASIAGVLQNKPTLGGQAATIMINGVSKVKAAGSTVGTGDIISASTAGFAVELSTDDYAVGRVLAGSSGSTGRVLTILLQNIGTT